MKTKHVWRSGNLNAGTMLRIGNKCFTLTAHQKRIDVIDTNSHYVLLRDCMPKNLAVILNAAGAVPLGTVRNPVVEAKVTAPREWKPCDIKVGLEVVGPEVGKLKVCTSRRFLSTFDLVKPDGLAFRLDATHAMVSIVFNKGNFEEVL